ncbi:MAG: flippase-like domain-containing protein [Solirubrobacteraceae bacterium]|nr:flippase-like domain-containing protein [Solirubrobacteraceae bacterium]
MRIALVSPYSWTYPGGVTRHIEALATELLATGHDVRVLAPVDPDDALSVRLHRGARPQARAMPEWLVPLGRTVGLPFNGAVSTLALHPHAVSAFRTAIAEFRPDVIHVHEPMAPTAGWEACNASPHIPVVGTFHAYATSPVTNNLGNLAGAWRRFNRLHARIAVSEAAAWTGRRFFGGTYTVIPNGVQVAPQLAPKAPRLDGDPLKIAFVGQAVERKGLEVLLPAFEALRDHVPAQLTIVGASRDEIEPLLLDPRGVTALGKVDDVAKTAILRGADLLCAPSLGGESFGMVLTEAFAAGTPVVASDIAGYRDVVRDGVDGVLVPRADPMALATTLRELALTPARTTAMGVEAARSADRFSWPHVTEEIVGVYEEARTVPEPATAGARFAVRHGLATADGRPMERPRRIPRPEPPAPAGAGRRRPVIAFLRRAALGLAGLATILLALLALQRIGVDRVVTSLVHSQPAWVVAGLGVMCASMVLRAVSWRAILRAGLPDSVISFGVAMRATSIGVLMSATLPARLGEPSRALIVARRVGRPRETLPVVVGTIVSQTLLNALALVILGVIMFSTVDVFTKSGPLVLAAVAPVVLVLTVVLAPLLAGRGANGESRLAAFAERARAALLRARSGLLVFRSPKLGAEATVFQLSAWVLQAVSCYFLLVALGIDDHAGFGAAAAVLFAVNVTAVLPLTPSNIGTFQLACAAVLGAYGVSYADGIAYGVILQAVEVATAFIMGAPALVREGVTWRDVRVRALHTSPVELPPLPASADA